MSKILRNNKVYLIVIFAVLAAALAVWQATAEPEQCVLCRGLKCHAPCIVNLATGEVGEMVIYEPHPTLVGEIAEEQTGGTLAFFSCAGQKAVCDSDAGTCSVGLPENYKKMNLQYFCKSCRALFAGMKGYALADLYDMDAILMYPIIDGVKYEIRGYTVAICLDEKTEKLMVTAYGNAVKAEERET